MERKRSDATFHRYLDLADQFKEVSYEGEVDFRGSSCHVLKGSTESGRAETFYFNKGTGLMVYTERPEAKVEMREYRDHGGVRSPTVFLIHPVDPPSAPMTMKIEKVTLGVEVDDSIFAMPAE